MRSVTNKSKHPGERLITVMAAGLSAMLLSGCGPSGLIPALGPQISYDTPALRELKAAAHIQTCPRVTAPPTGDLHTTLPCLGGGPSINLASLRGPLLLNLWEASCVPCRTEMPILESFSHKYEWRVAVLGDDLVDSQPDQSLEFAKSVGATYPMVADFNNTIRTVTTPTTILLNAEGHVVFDQPIQFVSEAQLQQLVQQRLGVRP